jgi:hypothetical protein
LLDIAGLIFLREAMSVAANAPFMAAAATELAPLHAKLNERAISKRSHSQKNTNSSKPYVTILLPGSQ